MTRFQRPVFSLRAPPSLLGSLLFGWLALACASTGGGAEREVLVRLRDYRSGASYELASESHTDRVSYYSGARSDASRKIQTDEIMSAFVGELGRQGFGDHAEPGTVPSADSRGVLRWGLDVQGSGGTTHWLIGTGSAPDDWNEFQRCRDTFLELYNITVSYQAVQNQSGRGFFGEPEPSPAAGKKTP